MTDKRKKSEHRRADVELRLRQLENNIREELELLNEYERKLRLSKDPKKIKKLEYEISTLKASIAKNQEEYDSLRNSNTRRHSSDVRCESAPDDKAPLKPTSAVDPQLSFPLGQATSVRNMTSRLTKR